MIGHGPRTTKPSDKWSLPKDLASKQAADKRRVDDLGKTDSKGKG